MLSFVFIIFSSTDIPYICVGFFLRKKKTPLHFNNKISQQIASSLMNFGVGRAFVY